MSVSGQGRALSASFRGGGSARAAAGAGAGAGAAAAQGGAAAGVANGAAEGAGAGSAAGAGSSAAGENPFLRGMGPAPTFNMDDDCEEQGGWEDGAEGAMGMLEQGRPWEASPFEAELKRSAPLVCSSLRPALAE